MRWGINITVKAECNWKEGAKAEIRNKNSLSQPSWSYCYQGLLAAMHQSSKETLKPIAWYIYSMIHGHWMFYKHIYWAVFLSIVSFFRKLSPGKALADYSYLRIDFIAVLVISIATQAINSSVCLWPTLLIHENCSPMQASVRRCLVTPFPPAVHSLNLEQIGMCLGMARWGLPAGTGQAALTQISKMVFSAQIKISVLGSADWLFLWHGLHPAPLWHRLSDHRERAEMGKAGG